MYKTSLTFSLSLPLASSRVRFTLHATRDNKRSSNQLCARGHLADRKVCSQGNVLADEEQSECCFDFPRVRKNAILAFFRYRCIQLNGHYSLLNEKQLCFWSAEFDNSPNGAGAVLVRRQRF